MMALRKYDLVTQDLCVALTGELPPAEHGAPDGRARSPARLDKRQGGATLFGSAQ